MKKSPNDAPEGAILQRDNETYAIVPRTPVGLLNAEHLEKVASVVRKFDIPIIKITSGQRFALVGIKEEQLDNVWKDLEMDQGRAKTNELCMHYVQACPGTEVCRYGKQDSLGLGNEIEEMFTGKPLLAKFKLGVSGCTFCCAESYVRDIGFVGTKNGWTLSIGGNSGGRPRIGDVIAKDLEKEDAIELMKKFVDFYMDNAKKRERTARFVERIGLDNIKEAILPKE